MAFDLLLKRGSANQILEVTIRDASTGQGKTGIAPASVTYSYVTRGAGSIGSGTCVAMTRGTWVSGDWTEVDANLRPGEYQFGVPLAAVSSGDAVTLRFKIAAAIDKEVKIVLTAIDVQDGTAAGISRIDAAISSVGGGTSLTAADIWSYATRTLSNGAITSASFAAGAINATVAPNLDAAVSTRLASTDKTGFTLATTQAFNNTGQTTVLPANLTQINGTAAASSVSASKAYLGTITQFWGGVGTGVGLINGYPAVALADASAAGQTKIADAVWNAASGSYVLAGSLGGAITTIKTVADKLDSTLELDGSVYRFTSNALELGPTGTGGGLTAADVWSYAARTLTAPVDINSNADLTTILGRVDVAVSTRLAAADYVAGGGGGLTAAEVWSYATRKLTDGSITTATFEGGAINSIVAPCLDASIALTGLEVAAIRAQTDKLYFNTADGSTYEVKAYGLNSSDSAILDAIKYTTDKLDTALELDGDGSVFLYRFTANALALVPAGGGTALTAADVWSYPTRSLTDDVVLSAADRATLDAIKGKTDQFVFINGDVVATLDGETVAADSTAIADAVWDEQTAAHTILGSFGDLLASNIDTPLTPTDIAIGVWGYATRTLTATIDSDSIANAVWASVTRTLTSAQNITSDGMAISYVTPDNAALAAIKAQTDQLTFNGGVVASLPAHAISTATFAPGAITAAVAPNLDVPVSTRLAAGDFVAPDNAALAAIQAQTDKLYFIAAGDGTWNVRTVGDPEGVASAVWSYATRTITGGSIDAYQADWSPTEKGQIRYALGLGGPKTVTEDGIIDNLNRVALKFQFNSESDVLATLAGESVYLNPIQNFNNTGQLDEQPAEDRTLRLRLTEARAGKLDNLDVAVSTRSSHSPADVWSFNERTLTNYGTLVADIAAAVWTFGTRSLTSLGTLVADIWNYAVRTITGGSVDLSAQAKLDVRQAADQALAVYDPPTRAEAVFDRDQIMAQVQAVLGAVNGHPDADTIAAAVDAVLSAAHGAGLWIDTRHGVGPVALEVVVTDGTHPVSFASVRLAVGPLGISALTEADGVAHFQVQPGTYALQVAKLGYSSANGTVLVAEDPTEQSTAAVITALQTVAAPAEPEKTTGYLVTYDAIGNMQPNVEIEFRLVAPPEGSVAEAYPGVPFKAASDANGLVQATLLKNAAYQARRGAGEWVLAKTDLRDTYPLPTVLSHPTR